MADKGITPSFNILGSTTCVGGTTYVSSITGIMYRDSIGYQVNGVGALTGTINIDTSFDYNPGTPQGGGVVSPGNWTTIVGQAVSSGTLFPVVFNLNQIAGPYTRLSFVSSTSSGTIAAWVACKSLG